MPNPTARAKPIKVVSKVIQELRASGPAYSTKAFAIAVGGGRKNSGILSR
jgi:hypothetical protein